MSAMANAGAEELTTVTWNVAAVNNNPLEYWTTYDAPAYKQLMVDIEGLLDAPGDRDVPLSAVFPAAAMAELCAAMRAVGWDGVEEVAAIWDADLAARPFVSGFLKDKALGAKRFMSMPDRFTNTVHTVDLATGLPGPTACRPSVINNYVGDLSSFGAWFAAWKAFMFEQPVNVVGKGGVAKATVPYQMVGKIPRAKYPELSADEERLSMPMQVVCLALFDAALVHAMNSLSPSGEWLVIKRRLCDALFVNKQARTLEVLCSPPYAGCDVLFLQEVAGNFVPKLVAGLGGSHHVLAPAKLDSARDQNSVLLLKKSTFPAAGVETSDAVRAYLEGSGVVDGDVVSCTAADAHGRKWFLASFHGDTNGLQSVPLLQAVHAAAAAEGAPLLLGLDANVHEAVTKGAAHYLDWCAAYTNLGLVSNWGAATIDPVAARTTYNARTFVQPQLQKAVRLAEFTKGDCNPKDYVVYSPAVLEAVGASRRDNDGSGGATFAETPIPSLAWPSDHAAVFATLRAVAT